MMSFFKEIKQPASKMASFRLVLKFKRNKFRHSEHLGKGKKRVFFCEGEGKGDPSNFLRKTAPETHG